MDCQPGNPSYISLNKAGEGFDRTPRLCQVLPKLRLKFGSKIAANIAAINNLRRLGPTRSQRWY